MSEYILSCCSTADLSREHLENRSISYICFHYSMDGQDYRDDLGQSMSYEEFYRRMDQGADTRTSQINIAEYVEYFEALLAQGKNVVHISLSSGLSGSVNSARNAALIVNERSEGHCVYVVDSLGASSGYGLIVDDAADQRDAGVSAEELVAWLEENKKKMHHWFFSTDLSAYVRGGRISKTSAVFGGLLEICPLLNMDHEGRLVPRHKIRTKKKVIREIVKKMEEHARDGLAYNGKCYMCHSACLEDARQVADQVEEKFPNLKGKVLIHSIGTTIGAHTGSGTVALFFWGDERCD